MKQVFSFKLSQVGTQWWCLKLHESSLQKLHIWPSVVVCRGITIVFCVQWWSWSRVSMIINTSVNYRYKKNVVKYSEIRAYRLQCLNQPANRFSWWSTAPRPPYCWKAWTLWLSTSSTFTPWSTRGAASLWRAPRPPVSVRRLRFLSARCPVAFLRLWLWESVPSTHLVR